MNCKSCKEKIEEGSKFCAGCGAKVEAVVKADTKNLNAIKNHLEFLGYTVELTETDKEGERNFLIATHSKDANFVIVELEPFITNFRATFTTEKPYSPVMEKAINELAAALDVSNIFFQIEEGKAVLRIDAVYTGEYSKDVFGRYFALLIKDIGKIFRLESTKDAFTG